MKKFLLSLVGLTFGLTGFVASADDMTWISVQSDFNTFNNSAAKSQYGTYTTSYGWTATNCQIIGGLPSGETDNSSTYYEFIGDSKSILAPVLNGKTSAVGSLKSPTLSNGIGTLKMNYGYPFSENNGVDFTVNIIQGGETKKSASCVVAKADVAQKTAYEYEVELNVEGSFSIEIINNSPSKNTGNKDRLAIWNIQYTNCESAKSEPTLSFSEELVEVTGYPLPTEITEPTLTVTPDNLTITYRSTNTNVATVDTEGKITILSYGTTTIYASSASTDEYNAGEASYNISILPGEITVANALEILDDATGIQATVTGIISQIDEISLDYGNATYFIKDDLNDEESLEVFRGYSLNGENFTTEDEIVVGATVKVSGSLVVYNGTKEFTTGSQILEYSAPTNGIQSFENVLEGDGIFYNLQGIKVNNPVKGQIYIVNGKKVIF